MKKTIKEQFGCSPHPNLNTIGCTTGRVSISSPNLSSPSKSKVSIPSLTGKTLTIKDFSTVKPVKNKRKKKKLLRLLKEAYNKPCIVLGDFTILKDTNK